MGFKEDADFARFVSMGAIASDAVRRHLRVAHGHRIIELERYAMANKVWQTKVKRLRLPDLACVNCGLRIESRGKSQLGIVLSHSDREGRAWDGGGMRDDDLYAFLRVDLADSSPHTSIPIYFRTADLRAMVGHAKESSRKAVSEGAEVTLTWPTWVPKKSGHFIDVDEQGRLHCAWDSGGGYRYHQWQKWPQQCIYVAPGDAIQADETIVAGIVAPPGDLACPGGTWNLRYALEGDDEVERYAAIRAIGVARDAGLAEVLHDIAQSGIEDWRIQVEALASLARIRPTQWTQAIEGVALDQTLEDAQRIEAVLVLSEIDTDEAAASLARVANDSAGTPVEIRAAATWGLGQGAHPSAERLLRFVVDEDDLIALHALTAMDELPDTLLPSLRGWLSEGNDRRAAVAAQLLLRHRAVRVLLEIASRGGRGRLWALRALGDLPPELVRSQGSDLLTPELEGSLAPLWIGQVDWLRGDAAEGLDALDVQKVRFDPVGPNDR